MTLAQQRQALAGIGCAVLHEGSHGHVGAVERFERPYAGRHNHPEALSRLVKLHADTLGPDHFDAGYSLDKNIRNKVRIDRIARYCYSHSNPPLQATADSYRQRQCALSDIKTHSKSVAAAYLTRASGYGTPSPRSASANETLTSKATAASVEQRRIKTGDGSPSKTAITMRPSAARSAVDVWKSTISVRMPVLPSVGAL